jgi:hypothetical protein
MSDSTAEDNIESLRSMLALCVKQIEGNIKDNEGGEFNGIYLQQIREASKVVSELTSSLSRLKRISEIDIHAMPLREKASLIVEMVNEWPLENRLYVRDNVSGLDLDK